MQNWYAIYTKPRAERTVAEKFADCGFTVLSPLLKERRIYRRQLKDVVSPLFPCYIFVNVDIERNWRLVKYTRGVRSIVGTAYAPSVVPEPIIKSMLDRMAGGLITARQQFVPGEEVIIRAGAFEGFEALFDRELSGSDRVSILLKALNAKVTLDRALLARP